MGSWCCLVAEGDFFLFFDSGCAGDGAESSTLLNAVRPTGDTEDIMGPSMEALAGTVSTATGICVFIILCCAPVFKPTADSPVPYITFGVAEANEASASTNTELLYCCAVVAFVNWLKQTEPAGGSGWFPEDMLLIVTDETLFFVLFSSCCVELLALKIPISV